MPTDSPAMTTQLLIDAIVRQTTILIAQLATKQGSRTPLADIAEQVFGELAQELHRQGVSRKVAADMFGMALRTYKRRVQRLGESETVAGRSLWEAVHDFLHQRPVATQEEVLVHFHRDDEQIVRGVLADLVDSGLVFRAGRGAGSTYRAATGADLDHARTAPRDPDGMDTLVWAVVYRLGPIERSRLGGHVGLPASDLDASLARLVGAKNIVRTEVNGTDGYAAHGFLVSLDQSNGWEGAVFDHFQAVVTTICRKLTTDANAPTAADNVGGSTSGKKVGAWRGCIPEFELTACATRYTQPVQTTVMCRAVCPNTNPPTCGVCYDEPAPVTASTPVEYAWEGYLYTDGSSGGRPCAERTALAATRYRIKVPVYSDSPPMLPSGGYEKVPLYTVSVDFTTSPNGVVEIPIDQGP